MGGAFVICLGCLNDACCGLERALASIGGHHSFGEVPLCSFISS